MKKSIIIATVLIIIDILFYSQSIKIDKAKSKELFTVKNYVSRLSKFKKYLDCNYPVLLYIKSSEKMDSSLFDSQTLARYALSPCPIDFRGEAKVLNEKGVYIINSLHQDFELYSKNSKIILQESDFLIFEIQ